MIPWLRRIMGLCEHKWRIVNSGPIMTDGKRVGNYYDLVCEKCGKMAVRNLK